jgi:UDP-4-amino-4,6-dideoxy-N-acetyl-beta-L-altrosamine N-acetyltransferase
VTAPQVTFRAVQEGDRDRLLVWRNSPAVAAYMYSDHAITAEEHVRWFAGLEADLSRVYWIIEMDGAPVGLVNLYDVKPTECAWAYYLADPATRGRGVGAYVELRMLDHVFSGLGLDRLWCEVLEDNDAVWKLHQSFGFEVVERLEGRAVKAGIARDALRLVLTADVWARVRPDCAERLTARGFELINPPSLGEGDQTKSGGGGL